MGITPYFGPQWWILPDIVVNELLHFYENKDYCNCIKDCFSCDETFCQTAIMVHADHFGITLNEDGYYLGKKWFTIFSHGHPHLLTQNHFKQLTSSGMLFARKFDLDKDAVVLDMLDKHSADMRNKEIPD